MPSPDTERCSYTGGNAYTLYMLTFGTSRGASNYSLWTLGKPDERSGDSGEGGITLGEFIVAGGHVPELFEAGKEPFNQVAMLVSILIEGALLLARGGITGCADMWAI